MKLNLGCGMAKRDGFINCDVNPECNPDIFTGLPKLKFRSNTFDYIYCHHVLEHIDYPFVKIMEELWRVSKPDAVVEIHVPHWMNHGAYCHPEHIRYFDFHTFEWFEKKLQEKKISQTRKPRCSFLVIHKEFRYRETDHTNTKARWFSRIPIQIINILANKYKDSFDRFWGYWVGGCDEIIVKMRVIKA